MSYTAEELKKLQCDLKIAKAINSLLKAIIKHLVKRNEVLKKEKEELLELLMSEASSESREEEILEAEGVVLENNKVQVKPEMDSKVLVEAPEFTSEAQIVSESDSDIGSIKFSPLLGKEIKMVDSPKLGDQTSDVGFIHNSPETGEEKNQEQPEPIKYSPLFGEDKSDLWPIELDEQSQWIAELTRAVKSVVVAPGAIGVGSDPNRVLVQDLSETRAELRGKPDRLRVQMAFWEKQNLENTEGLKVPHPGPWMNPAQMDNVGSTGYPKLRDQVMDQLEASELFKDISEALSMAQMELEADRVLARNAGEASGSEEK